MATSRRDYEWAAAYVLGMREGPCEDHEECVGNRMVAHACAARRRAAGLAQPRADSVELAFISLFSRDLGFNQKRFQQACALKVKP
jgi:hypothetical protein